VNNLFNNVREHAPALIVAVIIGVATGAPQFYVVHQMGTAYQGVFPGTTDDDRYYQARSEEVRDGFPMLGNPYIYELRNAPSVSFWLPDAAFSYAGEFLGLDVQHTFAFFDFLLPPILFLVTYGILLYATGRRTLALCAASFFHLGFFLTTFFRSPSPQLNFLFVELAVFAALRFIREAPYRIPVLALSLGALFYVYPYYWTFMDGVVGSFLILTFMRRDLLPLSLPLFVSLILAAIIGGPVLLQTLGHHTPVYAESLIRLGLVMTHTPAGLWNVTICCFTGLAYIVTLLYSRSFRNEKLAWFFTSAIWGALIASNNQIITGQNLEYSSHYYLPVAYIGLLCCAYLFAFFFGQMRQIHLKRYAGAAFVSVVTCLTILGASESVYVRMQVTSQALQEQRFGPVLSWLKTSSASESVVMASESLSIDIGAFTGNRVFYVHNANLHVMTNEEVWTRYLLEHQDDTLSDTYLLQHVGEIWGTHYQDVYGYTTQLNKLRKILGMAPLPAKLLPDSAIEDFRAFAAKLRKEPAGEALGDRRLDYAIEEPGFTLPSWLKSEFPSMHEVYTANDLTIFELGPKKK